MSANRLSSASLFSAVTSSNATVALLISSSIIEVLTSFLGKASSASTETLVPEI